VPLIKAGRGRKARRNGRIVEHIGDDIKTNEGKG
jgi:hypothetical protein